MTEIPSPVVMVEDMVVGGAGVSGGGPGSPGNDNSSGGTGGGGGTSRFDPVVAILEVEVSIQVMVMDLSNMTYPMEKELKQL